MRASYYQKIALQKISDYNHNLKLQQLNKRTYSPIREEQELQYQQQNMFLDTIQIVKTQLHYHRPRRNYIKPTDLNKNYTTMWLRSKGVDNHSPIPIRKNDSAQSGRRSPLMLTLDKFNEIFVAQNERALAKAEQLLLQSIQEQSYQRTDFAGLCERLSNENIIEDVVEYVYLQKRYILTKLLINKLCIKLSLLQKYNSLKQRKQKQPELDIQLESEQQKDRTEEKLTIPQAEQQEIIQTHDLPNEGNNNVRIDLVNLNFDKQVIKMNYTAERKFIVPYVTNNE